MPSSAAPAMATSFILSRRPYTSAVRLIGNTPNEGCGRPRRLPRAESPSLGPLLAPCFGSRHVVRRIEIERCPRIDQFSGWSPRARQEGTRANVTAERECVFVILERQNRRRTDVAAVTRETRLQGRQAPLVAERAEVFRDDAIVVARQDEQCRATLLRGADGAAQRGG